MRFRLGVHSASVTQCKAGLSMSRRRRTRRRRTGWATCTHPKHVLLLLHIERLFHAAFVLAKALSLVPAHALQHALPKPTKPARLVNPNSSDISGR